MRGEPTAQIDISIVIVSWNTRELLAACLESIATSVIVGATPTVRPTIETFVVDNASGDGSPEMVATNFPWVRLVKNAQNVGFAQGNNQAIEQASGRYVLLLNPDTKLKPGSLGLLYGFLESRPEIGMVGPRLLNGDGSLQLSCFKAPTLLREFWLLFHLDAIFPTISNYPVEKWDRSPMTSAISKIDLARPVEVLKGACMLLRRPIFEQIGLLNTTYFMYSEEVDLCYRVRRAGWGIAWLPQAEVIHYGGQSTSQVADKMFLRLYEAKTLYFRLNYGRPTALIYKIILLLASLTRLALTPLAWLEGAKRRQNHLALAGRYWQLVQMLPTL